MTGKIRSQEIRDLFFKLKFIVNLKIKVIKSYLEVSISTLYKWIQEGQIKPINSTRVKGSNKFNNNITRDIVNFILNNNTKTLKEISIYIDSKYQINISISTIHRFCIKNSLTYKKGSKCYIEANLKKQEEFMKNIRQKSRDKIIALDEACFS